MYEVMCLTAARVLLTVRLPPTTPHHTAITVVRHILEVTLHQCSDC